MAKRRAASVVCVYAGTFRTYADTLRQWKEKYYTIKMLIIKTCKKIKKKSINELSRAEQVKLKKYVYLSFFFFPSRPPKSNKFVARVQSPGDLHYSIHSRLYIHLFPLIVYDDNNIHLNVFRKCFFFFLLAIKTTTAVSLLMLLICTS